KGLVLISVPLLFHLVFFAVLADMQHSSDIATASSLHSKEVLRQIQAVSRSLREAGDSLRGVFLTPAPEMLVDFDRSDKQVAQDVLELQNRVQDNPDQLAHAQAIATAAQEFLNWHNETVRLASNGQRRQAIIHGKDPISNRLLEELRQAVATF